MLKSVSANGNTKSNDNDTEDFVNGKKELYPDLEERINSMMVDFTPHYKLIFEKLRIINSCNTDFILFTEKKMKRT